MNNKILSLKFLSRSLRLKKRKGACYIFKMRFKRISHNFFSRFFPIPRQFFLKSAVTGLSKQLSPVSRFLKQIKGKVLNSLFFCTSTKHLLKETAFYLSGRPSVFFRKKIPVFRFVFLALSFSCFPGGGIGGRGLSRNVLVIPLPYGRGDVIQPRRPRVTYSLQEETVPCRREYPNLRSIRDKTDLDVIANILLEDLIQEEEARDPQQRAERREPVNVSVSGGWIKMGLLIDNKNTGVGRNYTLLVERLEYSADGQCEKEGLPPCKTHDTITSGYCVLPFLYLVPSGKRVDYKPLSNDPLHNLTIYLDGLKVVDRTRLEEREGEDPLPGGVSLILPKYKITMTLMGSFLLEDGTTVEPFLKTIRFQTSARRAY